MTSPGPLQPGTGVAMSADYAYRVFVGGLVPKFCAFHCLSVRPGKIILKIKLVNSPNVLRCLLRSLNSKRSDG